jgi:hypothetical protein
VAAHPHHTRGVKVSAPDGRTWKVGRRWFPRRKRLGRADVSDAWPDFLDLDGGLDDLGVVGTIIAAILLVIVAIFLALVLFNVIAIALELLLLVLLLLAGVFARVVLRRPWIVQARSGDAVLEWPVAGWRPSGRKIADVAEQLRSGAQIDAPRQHR